jgi:transcription-repair coupling factor (superfamily II helicase)
VLTPGLPQTGDQLVWTGLSGDSLPLAIASAARELNNVLVVVTPDMQTAELLHDQVHFFLGHQSLPVTTFPDWETLPYDNFSPHPDIVSERLATLYGLPEQQRGLLIVSAPTLLQRLPPRDYIFQNSLILKTGDTLNLDEMRTRLESAGYRCVSQVLEHGEFAVRGSLLDLYPMGNPLPFRFDLFDDDIESIKTFDTETQRSLDALESVRMLPAREFPMDEAAIRTFRYRFRTMFAGDPQNCPVYRDVSNGIAPAGIEYYLPLFLEETCTLFDYLPDDACLLQLDATATACESFQEQLQERYEARRHNVERPLPAPSLLFIEQQEFQQRLSGVTQIRVDLFKGTRSANTKLEFSVGQTGDLRLRPRMESW